MKKAILWLTLLFAMACLLSSPAMAADIWDGSTATSFAGGSGTEDDPYLIENGAQLALVDAYPEEHFRLTADIYLNASDDWEDWTAENGPSNVWSPLSANGYFSGVLDGDGHTIYGLYVSKTEDYAGLFGRITDSAFRNLSIRESAVFGNDTGLLAGYAGNTTIQNCHAAGAVSGAISGGHSLAGLVGTASDCIISNCTNSASVCSNGSADSGWVFTGGIVGLLSNGTLENCSNTGTVIGSGGYVCNCTGGIAGRVNKSLVIACQNIAAVSGIEYTGGVIGSLVTKSQVLNCSNSGNITCSNDYCGGIAGYADSNSNSCIQNSFNSGTVSGNEYCGGIIGYLSKACSIFNCRNTGGISAFSNAGGICGGTLGNSHIANCLNIGLVAATDTPSDCGAITSFNRGCTMVHNYYLEDSCSETDDAETATEVTDEEALSEEFLETLNNWVVSAQRPNTAYTFWEADEDGYPVPTDEVPAYIPVAGNLTLIPPENGTAVLSADSALTETKITVQVAANAGYIPYQVWYLAEEAPDAAVYAARESENTFTFPMPYGDAEVHVEFLKLPEEGSVWDGTVADSFAGGDGSENNPYLIATGEQLALVDQCLVYTDEVYYFKLITDIYLNDVEGWEDWTAESGPANIWEPVRLLGSFDGNGHTVYGLYTDASKSNQGLFTWWGTSGKHYHYIKDLTIDKSKIFGTCDVGALGGSIGNSYIYDISGCINRGDVFASSQWGGGLLGSCDEGTIKNCANYGNISGCGHIGGIAGHLVSVQVENCVNYGDIIGVVKSEDDTSGWNIGGLFPEAINSTIKNCTNNGTVSGVSYVGGICAALSGYSKETATCISQSVNNGTVSASGTLAGGIFAEGETYKEGSFVVDRCLNQGTVSVADGRAGGIAGGISVYSGSGKAAAYNCINAGTVSGTWAVGGLAGELIAGGMGEILFETSYSSGTVSGVQSISGTVGQICTEAAGAEIVVRNCYSLSGTVSADVTCYGGPGTESVVHVKALTSAQMGQQSSFVGFDFDTVWYCAGDGSYPTLLLVSGSGQMGEVLDFAVYQNGAVSVTADVSNVEPVYALLVSYQDGQMKGMDMIQLDPGEEGMLTLMEQGDRAQLFALSSNWVPFCKNQEI